MGLGANLICGYAINVKDIEWDRGQLQYRLEESKELGDKEISSLINDLFEPLDGFDGDAILEVANLLNLDLIQVEDDKDWYILVLRYSDLIQVGWNTKMKNVDEIVENYAGYMGIDNYYDVKWIERAFITH